MAHQGTWIAFLLFLIPGFPKDYLCYLLGLGHMDLKTFLIISTVGRFLGTALLTYQGHLAREKETLVLGIDDGISLFLLVGAYFLRPRLEAAIRRHRDLHHWKVSEKHRKEKKTTVRNKGRKRSGYRRPFHKPPGGNGPAALYQYPLGVDWGGN